MHWRSPNWRTTALGTVTLTLVIVVAWLHRETPEPTVHARTDLFAKFDRDGNGVARLSEVPKELRKQFEFLLANAGQTETGALTRTQFERAIHRSKESPKLEDQAESQAERNKGPVAEDKPARGQQTKNEPRSDTFNVASGDQIDMPMLQPVTAENEADQVPEGDVAVDYSRTRLFEWLDGDHDGRLSAPEIPDSFRNVLLIADRNRDQCLTLSEFSRGIDMASHAKGSPAVRSGNTAVRHGGIISRPAPGESIPIYVRRTPEAPRVAGLPDWFAERDKNRDKQVAQQEWPADNLDEFRRLDSNQDGFISTDEAVAGNAASKGGATTASHPSSLQAHK